jgi:hypothetical protein
MASSQAQDLSDLREKPNYLQQLGTPQDLATSAQKWCGNLPFDHGNGQQVDLLDFVTPNAEYQAYIVKNLKYPCYT